MTAVATSTTAIITLADLLEQLGDIAPARVRFRPVPGTATEKDVLSIHDREDRLYELVDGVLVEKAMGFRESLLAGMFIEILRGFVRARNLGLVTAPDGMMRLAAGLVRIPDVAPDLAVEVLSAGNTPGEMARTRQDYFAARAQVVWQVTHTRVPCRYLRPLSSLRYSTRRRHWKAVRYYRASLCRSKHYSANWTVRGRTDPNGRQYVL